MPDHPVNLLYLRKTLKKLGISKIIEASNGTKALELFKADNEYSLILLDCQMPDMDGFTVAQEMREFEVGDTKVPIIAVTADAMAGAKEKCMKAGMNDYLTKPINKDHLNDLLHKWLEFKVGEPVMPQEKTDKVNGQNQAESHIFDWSRLREFTDGDPQEEKEIINIFIESLQTDLGCLQTSYDQANYEEWDGWVHKLYGACSHIGAHSMAEICDEGQTLFPDHIDKIPQMHKAIFNEYQRVQDILK